MPQVVDKAMRYSDEAAFLRDEAQLAEQGWKVTAVRHVEEPGGAFARLLRRPPPEELDVTYQRDSWPLEEDPLWSDR
jgi:hypothetical protein